MIIILKIAHAIRERRKTYIINASSSDHEYFIEDVTQYAFKDHMSKEGLRRQTDCLSSGLKRYFLQRVSQESKGRFKRILKSMQSAVLAFTHAENLTNVLPHLTE